jgi:hypothetical protein
VHELNGRKCKAIHFGNSQLVRNVERSYSVTFQGETSELAISESERDLGIQVQPDLKCKEHTQICSN